MLFNLKKLNFNFSACLRIRVNNDSGVKTKRRQLEPLGFLLSVFVSVAASLGGPWGFRFNLQKLYFNISVCPECSFFMLCKRVNNDSGLKSRQLEPLVFSDFQYLYHQLCSENERLHSD